MLSSKSSLQIFFFEITFYCLSKCWFTLTISEFYPTITPKLFCLLCLIFPPLYPIYHQLMVLKDFYPLYSIRYFNYELKYLLIVSNEYSFEGLRAL